MRFFGKNKTMPARSVLYPFLDSKDHDATWQHSNTELPIRKGLWRVDTWDQVYGCTDSPTTLRGEFCIQNSDFTACRIHHILMIDWAPSWAIWGHYIQTAAMNYGSRVRVKPARPLGHCPPSPLLLWPPSDTPYLWPPTPGSDGHFPVTREMLIPLSWRPCGLGARWTFLFQPHMQMSPYTTQIKKEIDDK